VRDVRQLVSQHCLELRLVQAAQDACRDADDGVLLVATGRERVRHVDVRDRHLGLGHVGHRAQPVDNAVKLRRLLAGDDLATHRVQRDPVRVEVLHEEQDDRDDEDEDELDPDEEEHRDEDGVKEPEQEDCRDHAGREPAVCGKASAG